MAVICKRYTITGRVQGVAFRAATRAQAHRLSMSGWARNLANGDVEVLACGDAASQEALHAWLRRGPRYAEVRSVSAEGVDDAVPPPGFAIR